MFHYFLPLLSQNDKRLSRNEGGVLLFRLYNRKEGRVLTLRKRKYNLYFGTDSSRFDLRFQCHFLGRNNHPHDSPH